MIDEMPMQQVAEELKISIGMCISRDPELSPGCARSCSGTGGRRCTPLINNCEDLLCDDESSQELGLIAQHVENCVRCQSRLGQLTGVGKWTTELVRTLPQRQTLRDGLRSDDSHHTQPLTVVLDQVADLDDPNIEFDPVSLDFLGPSSHPQLLGRLGRYEIERVIGAGGMGLVLKGFDAELHRPVAIKVLAPHLAHSAAFANVLLAKHKPQQQ